MMYITTDNIISNTVGGSYHSAHQAVSFMEDHIDLVSFVEYRDEHVMWSYIYFIVLIAINNDLLEILLIRLQYLSLKHINLVLLVVEIIF